MFLMTTWAWRILYGFPIWTFVVCLICCILTSCTSQFIFISPFQIVLEMSKIAFSRNNETVNPFFTHDPRNLTPLLSCGSFKVSRRYGLSNKRCRRRQVRAYGSPGFEIQHGLWHMVGSRGPNRKELRVKSAETLDCLQSYWHRN